MEKDIINYYNKFCEDKRLNSRHGRVEFAVTMEFINRYIKDINRPKVIDIGAGTGKYSFALSDLGCEVSAVELVKYNLGILKSKGCGVKAYQGDARNLKKFQDNSFDVALLFGPMYHLLTYEDKLKSLLETRRVVKKGGLIFISYLMADYAILIHGFRDGKIQENIASGRVDKNYKLTAKEPDLYSYVRLETINKLKDDAGLNRETILAQDGASDYMRNVLNSMDEDTFRVFIDYQISVAERPELLGASSHVMDVLRV